MKKFILTAIAIAGITLTNCSNSPPPKCQPAVFFGDSITEGYGVNPNERWTSLLSKELKLCEINKGIGSTVLQNSPPRLPHNGRDRYIKDIVSYRPQKVYIVYGLNDLRHDSLDFSVENFKNDLEEIVRGLIKSGIKRKNIAVGSPPYISEITYGFYPPWNKGTEQKHKQYRDATKEVSNKYKVSWVDVYQYMKDNGSDALILPDYIHPNQYGHRAIADAFLLAN